ncbi:HAD family hydrolase [Salinispora arenicola]|uniref:HAD family hydrolase n=1 Tax=Salinispora arenicola TaxID=168697 RepID=UPI00036823F5|nr:HAD family hydrolase [Salinispora arenicola]
MLQPPRALLLDFGGVLAGAPHPLPVAPDLVARLSELIRDVVSAEQIAADVSAGTQAFERWRDDVERTGGPAESPAAQGWAEFIARTWPQAARDAVNREAIALAYAWTCRAEWEVRAGVPEALRFAADVGLPMAVVSNTLCGAANRDFLVAVGLSDLFAAELYSDEAGSRKPDPRLALLAAEALGVPIGDCWFVGDSVHRDIGCARRAGAGAVILMRSPRTDQEPSEPDLRPDARIEDGFGLLALLRQSTASPAGNDL